MMTDVVDLSAEREAREPHFEGPAICLACKHEFRQVNHHEAPEHTECPKCGLMKAVFKGPFVPNDDEVIWVCNCGSERFLVLTEGGINLFCESCGTRHDGREVVC